MEEDDYQYDEQDFMAGSSQIQQCGGGSNYLSTIIGDRRLGNLQLALLRRTMSDEQILFQSMLACAFEHNIISQVTQTGLQNLIDRLPHKKYKNPRALLLGYYMVERGEINLKKFESCKEMIIGFQGIRDADLIRYARLVISVSPSKPR